ncbi:hypothetical protein H0H93_011606 [Arthromyces matolae]|nr:hypothetical protein H0H93_011606 [Arthromyces matolae]
MRLTLVTAIALTYYFASVSLTTYAVAIPPASSNTLLNSDSLQPRTFGNFPVSVDDGLVLRAGGSVDGQNGQPKNEGKLFDRLILKLRNAFASHQARNEQRKCSQKLAILAAELEDDAKKIPGKRLTNGVWVDKILEYMELVRSEFEFLSPDERKTKKEQKAVGYFIDLLGMLIAPSNGQPVRSELVAKKAAELMPWWEKQKLNQQQPI